MNSSYFGHQLTQPEFSTTKVVVPTNDPLKAHLRDANVINRIPAQERESGNVDGGISRPSSALMQKKRKRSSSSMPIIYPSNLSDACGAFTTPANQTPEQPQAVNDYCSLSPDRFDTIGSNNNDIPPPTTTTHFRNDIFLADAPKPIARSATPVDLRRIESTQQLVFCASLMHNGPLLPNVESGTTEVFVSNSVERAWLRTMQEDPLARAHIRWLLSKLVAEFVKISPPESSAISEVVILGPALRRVDYRTLLSFFIEKFEHIPLQNIDLLGGLVQLVQTASPGFLVDDDLVRILESLRQHLESTYAPSREHVYSLVFAVAKVLEVMVTHEAKDLNWKRARHSLFTTLRDLKGVEDDEMLKFQVNYAHQTLLYLPDGESSWQAYLRRAESAVVGVPAVACVFKLDPMNAIASVEHLQQDAGNVDDVEKLNIDGARTLQAIAVGAAQAGEGVYWSNKKEAWFLALQAAYTFVREGRLVDFNKLVCDAGCRFDANFQLGICQILGEIAAGQLWDVDSRTRAIDFLGEIYKFEASQKKDIKIQKWVSSILRRISRMSWPVVSVHASVLLTNLKEDQADTKDRHPLHFYLPLPTSSPLLDRVQNISDVEHDVEYALACIESRSFDEPRYPFSIPPRAKATLLHSDDDSFPLMERVHEFLDSNRQVFLLLGDSGSGKSTFCRQLERELWDNYKVGSRIPLFIDLPTIKDPDSNLIRKYLRNHPIEDHRIQEITWHRQLLLICDGYDESQLTANLYATNQLSQLNEVKMVVSCRNTVLGRVYNHRFRPHESDKYYTMSSSLFEEATITPFTEDDIKDFITQYVMDRTAEKSLECVSVLSRDEYLRQLRAIPNVMDLAKNPFLLTLALKALPSLSADALNNTNLETTRLDLYDRFAKEWFQVSEKRIARAHLSQEAYRVFEQLCDMGFGERARDYSIRLATAIYVENRKCPFVEYIHLNHMDNQSWKAAFFGPDHESTLLREASPLSRAGAQHRFIHTSLLVYFATLGVSDLYASDDGGSGDSGGGGDDCHGGGSTLSGGGGNSSGGSGNSSGESGNSSGESGNSSDGSGNSSGGSGGSTGDNHNSTSGNGGMFDRTGGSGEGIGGSKGDGDDPQRRKDSTWSKRKGHSDKSRASTSSELLTKLNLFKTPAVLEFLVERAQSDPRFRKNMLMVIEQSKSLTNPDLAGANAITILFKSGERFHNVDLVSVRVPLDYTPEESTESTMLVTRGTGIGLVNVLLTLEAPVTGQEVLSYSQTTPTATLTTLTPLIQETQSTQRPPSPHSEHLPPTSNLRPYGYTTLSGSRLMLGLSESEHKVTTNEPMTQLNPQSSSLREETPSLFVSPYDSYRSLSSPLEVKPVPKGAFPKDVFPENLSAPTCKIRLPRLQENIESTEQLVYCISLLLRSSLSPAAVPGNDIDSDAALFSQESILDKAELDWLEEIKKDTMEQDRLHRLPIRMVEVFATDTTKNSVELAEIVALGPVLQKEPYRKLLSSLIKDFDDARILDVNLLQGLVKFVQCASPDYLVSDNLVKILSILRAHLQSTPQQVTKHSYHLTLAVSRILDVMADHKVQDRDRVLQHEPLSGVLSGLESNSDPYLMYQACYAFQALQYVPADESALQAVLRHSSSVVAGLAKVSAVFKLDLASVIEGLGNLQESVGGTNGVDPTINEVGSSLMESGQVIFDSLKKGLSTGQKRPWYSAIKAAYAFAQAGQLKDLRQLIFEAPCRHDPLFQWGICQLLGEIAVNPVWSVATRQQAITLLGYLFKVDRDWGCDESVKAWMMSIVAKLEADSDHAVNVVAHALLQDLKQDQCIPIKHSYTLTTRIPIPASSPILARMHNTTSIEYDPQNFQPQRFKETHLPVYIPPMAKASLQAPDEDRSSPMMMDPLRCDPEHRVRLLREECLNSAPSDIYIESCGYDKELEIARSPDNTSLDAPNPPSRPLMDIAQEFLEGSKQVLLIVGDPGSGKSNFVRQLKRSLWEEYGGSSNQIPFLVNLQDYPKTSSDLLGQVLKSEGFYSQQIQQLKRTGRQFVLICDGYDEAQATANIYNTNNFNGTGQWRVKLIITCRSDKIGRDSDNRFQPETPRYSFKKLDLFQKVATAPFTLSQIKEYVDKYVAHPPQYHNQQPSGGGQGAPWQSQLMFQDSQETQQLAVPSRPWSAQQYMDALTDIPSAMELVKNPHILSFVLGLLPEFAGPTQDVSRSRVSLDTLYKRIFDKYVEVAKSSHEQNVFNELIESGFSDSFMGTLKDLAVEIYTRQEDKPVVQYLHIRDKDKPESRWKARFFGTDPESRLFQESAPLIKSGNYYRFSHPSLLQYLYSLAVFDPDEAPGNDGPDGSGPSSGGSNSENAGRSAPGNLSRLSTGNMLQRELASQGGQTVGQRQTLEALERAQPLALSEKSFEKLRVTNIAKHSMTVQFLADRVQNSLQFKNWLVETVRESANNPSKDSADQTLAANAMTILVRSGMRFNSADLRGIKIQGANLTGGEFDSADLQGSDLRNTTLDKCWLREARLEESQLSGVEFGELPYVKLSETLVSSDCSSIGKPTTSAYSPDGKHYAVGFTSGYIIVFNTTEWKLAFSFQGSKRSISTVAFSPDSRLLAYGDSIGIVKARKNAIGITVDLVSFEAYDDFISDLAFSPDGLKIATASVDNKIGLWYAASGSCDWSKKGRRGGGSSVAFSPDGKVLVSGGPDKTIRLWDVTTGESRGELKGHTDAISKVLFSPLGYQIASASSDKTVRVWSVRTRTCEHIFANHSDRVTGIAFSPDGQRLASCSEDSTIRTWEPRSGSTGPIYQGHKDQVICIAYSPDGKQFATCGRDMTLRRWYCRTATKGAVIFGRANTTSSGMYPYSTVKRRDNIDSNKSFQPTLHCPHVLTSRSGPFEGRGKVFAISPDGFLTATPCTNPFNVQLWRKGTNQPILSQLLIGHPKKISCIVFSPDNQHIASGSFDGSIRIWDTRLGFLVCTLTGNKSEVLSLAFTSAGQQIVTGSDDGTVRLWDELRGASLTDEESEGMLSTGRCLATFKNDKSILSVAISPSGQWVAAGGEDGVVRLWDVDSRDNNSVDLEGHQHSVNSIVFSPDNKHIASGSDDGTVSIWSMDTKHVKRVVQHGGAVKCLAFLSFGKQLASGGNNCKIWDFKAGELESILQHARDVVTIVSSLDGVNLWTGTEDRNVHEWRSAIAGQDTALVSTTAISGDSQLIASSLGGNSVHLWNTESGERRTVLSGHSRSIECLSFSPFSNLIATASSDGTVGIWNSETGEILKRLESHRGIVIGVTFSPKGDQIATVSTDQTLRLWNLLEFVPGHRLRIEVLGFPMEEEGTVVRAGEQGNNPHTEEQSTVPQTEEQGTGVQAAEQGDALHAIEQGYEDQMDCQGSIMQVDDQDSAMQLDEPSWKQGALWDKSMLEPMLEPYYHDDSGLAHAPVYSPDGEEVSVISAQHGILRFDTRTSASHPSLIDDSDTGMATCIAYSPRGDRMATSSEDNMVRVWDPETGNILFKLNGNTTSVTSVAFSPLDDQLATSGADGTICLWNVIRDVHEGNDLRLKGHEASVLCVSYSPDGKFLASGSADRTMRLWNPFDGELLAVVRDFAVGVKTIQWKVARGRLLLVTGCKENLPQVWELVEDIRDGKHEVRRYWGVGVDALAVSGACIGRGHGLSVENVTLLKQRNAKCLA